MTGVVVGLRSLCTGKQAWPGTAVGSCAVAVPQARVHPRVPRGSLRINSALCGNFRSSCVGSPYKPAEQEYGRCGTVFGRFCSDLSRRLKEAPPPADLTGCFGRSDRNANQPAGLVLISGVLRLHTDPACTQILFPGCVAGPVEPSPSQRKGAQAMSTIATRHDAGQQTGSDQTA